MSKRPLFISQVLPQLDTEDEDIIRRCGDINKIHVPGAIQAFGVLIGVREPDLTVTHVSENSQKVIGIPHQNILNQPLSAVFAPNDLSVLQGKLGSQNFDMVNPLRLPIQGKPFDIILHRNGGVLFLEIEPVNNAGESNIDVYRQLSQQAITAIMSSTSTDVLIQNTVDQIQKVSEFDRVMLYKFDEHYNGEVIGESLTPGTQTYMGQRFPGWETPRPVRDLYAKNPCRYIPHVFHVPAKVLSSSPAPLDMTYSQLRACADCHLQYMNNMGVASTMSFPVVINNKLWALIACHSIKPREVSYTHRMICYQVAQVFPQLLQQLEQPQQYQAQINQLRDKIANSLQPGNVAQSLLSVQADIMQMMASEGIAVYYQGQLHMAGQTPSQQDVQELVNTLCDQANRLVYQDNPSGLIYTSNLTKFLGRFAPSVNGLKDRLKHSASGLLAIPISKSTQDFLLIFRPEQPTECTWGGNPDKSMLFADKFNPMQLSPRSAFNAWKQLVQGTSISWIPYEVEAITFLRDKLVGMN